MSQECFLVLPFLLGINSIIIMIIILDNGRSEHYGVLCSGPQNSNSFKPLTSIWHPYETDPNFQMRKQGPWKLKRLAQGHRSGKWPRQDLKPQCEDTACDLLNHWAVLPPTEQHLGKCEVRAKAHTEVLLGPELDGCLLQDSSQLWVLEHFPKHVQKPFCWTHCCMLCALLLCPVVGWTGVSLHPEPMHHRSVGTSPLCF